MGFSATKIKGADKTVNAGALANLLQALKNKGRLYLVTVTNTGGVNQWIQIFDSKATPAANAVPLISVPVNAGQICSADFGQGRPFVNGIWVGNSTAAAAYVAGAADCLIDVALDDGGTNILAGGGAG